MAAHLASADAFLGPLKLSQYSAKFDEDGFEDPADLQGYNCDTLMSDFGMKKGHAIRLRKWLDGRGGSGDGDTPVVIATPIGEATISYEDTVRALELEIASHAASEPPAQRALSGDGGCDDGGTPAMSMPMAAAAAVEQDQLTDAAKNHALWFAAAHGDTDSVRALLADAESVDVNFEAVDGEYERSTPLHQAAYQNHMEVVQMLIAAGAEPNAQDSYGYTPLIWCCENHQAGMKHAPSVARLLLEAGADPDLAETYYGAGPLGWAAYYGKREVVALLLEFGASADKRDFSGKSAHDSARTDDIRALLESDPGVGKGARR